MLKKIKTESSNELLVVQHNNLIEAKYSLTLQEKRLLLLMSSRIHREDKQFQTYTFSVQEICTFLQLKNNNIYKEIDEVISKLFQRILIIRNGVENSITKISWLTYAKYWQGQGVIQLRFNEDLKPYMLQLKERFTPISLGEVIGLRSIHAIRIYELLKQYENIGKREIFLSDLREYCGITSKQYERFNDLKRFLLEIAKREINNKTDIFIDYEEIKTSRKITAINFVIKTNSNYEQTEFEKAQAEKAAILAKEYRSELALIERMGEYGFARLTSKKFIQIHGEEVVKNALRSVDLQVERGHVKNPKAMLQIAIKDKWHPEKYVDRKKKRD